VRAWCLERSCFRGVREASREGGSSTSYFGSVFSQTRALVRATLPVALPPSPVCRRRLHLFCSHLVNSEAERERKSPPVRCTTGYRPQTTFHSIIAGRKNLSLHFRRFHPKKTTKLYQSEKISNDDLKLSLILRCDFSYLSRLIFLYNG
jgi:hypothetical protein